MAVAMNPGIINYVQSGFIQKVNDAFVHVTSYSVHLFYLLAVIELALFGIIWAFRQVDGLSIFVMKLFKLGVIFFVITSFPHLLQALINGFTDVSFGIVSHNQDSQAFKDFIFNPAQIWGYGFNAGVSMLKLAVEYGTTNTGVSELYNILGFGTLLLFGLIGTQIVVTVVGFYLVALLALLLMPFGSFTPLKNMFEQAVRHVFVAGVRVFVVILVIGVGIGIWSQTQPVIVTHNTNLLQPLGLFFSGLVIWVMSIQLPGFVSKTVGHFSADLFTGFPQTVNVPQSQTMVSTQASSASSQATQAGTSITPGTAGVGARDTNAVQSAATVHASSSGATGSTIGAPTQVNKSTAVQGQGGKLAQGAEVKLGISNETLRKLKSTFSGAMKKHDK